MPLYVTLQLLKKHLQFFILLVLLFDAQSALANLVSAVDVNAGFSSINLKYLGTSSSLSSSTAVEVNYILKHQAISTAYVMSFYQMMFDTQGSKIPFSRFSVGARYYPMGFNGSRLIVDQGAQAQVWKATPFVGIHMGIANVSLRDTLPATSGGTSSGNVNASIIEMAPRFGVEIPFTASLLGQAQLILHSGNASGSASTQISYTGISAFVGIVLVDSK